MTDTWTDPFDGKVWTLPEDTKNSSLHIIMFAKGWYKGHFSTWCDIKDEDEHYMNQLKTIISKWSLVDEKYISDRDVLHHVCCLWEDYILPLKNSSGYHSVENLLMEAFYSYPTYGRSELRPVDIIKRMLGQLSILQVKNLPKLPEPSSDILPLNVKIEDEAPFNYEYGNDLFKHERLVFDVINNGEYLGKYVTNEEVNCFWLAYKHEDEYYIRLKETGSLWEVTKEDVQKFQKEVEVL